MESLITYVPFLSCQRRKLQAKLSEAEQAAEAANLKVQALEKAKNRLQGELEDLLIDVERVRCVLIRFLSLNRVA